MFVEKSVRVTNRGMICIPAPLRKKYNIKDGDELSIIEDEDGLKIILIEDIESIRRRSLSAKDMLEGMEQARQEEIELEF